MQTAFFAFEAMRSASYHNRPSNSCMPFAFSFENRYKINITTLDEWKRHLEIASPSLQVEILYQ